MHTVSTNFAKPTPNIKITSYCDVTNNVYPTIICLSYIMIVQPGSSRVKSVMDLYCCRLLSC